MKTFLLTLIAVCVITIVVEVVCPVKRMKSSVSLSLGLVLLVVIVGGIRALFNNEAKEVDYENYFLEIEGSAESIFNSSVESLENQIKKTLEAEGVEVQSIKIVYHINELKMEYDRVNVTLLKKEDEALAKKIVGEVIDVGAEDIWVSY